MTSTQCATTSSLSKCILYIIKHKCCKNTINTFWEQLHIQLLHSIVTKLLFCLDGENQLTQNFKMTYIKYKNYRCKCYFIPFLCPKQNPCSSMLITTNQAETDGEGAYFDWNLCGKGAKQERGQKKEGKTIGSFPLPVKNIK